MKASRRTQEAQRSETPSARSPSQARGRDRIESILDATAKVIIEQGLPAVTMHGVAKLAGAPVGSMYHFFPDRDALLAALRDRHDAALWELAEAIEATPMETWVRLSAEDLIDRLVSPYVEYIEQHPDCLQIMAGKTPDDGRHEKGTLRNHRIFAARLPHAKPADREMCAEMIDALAVGAMRYQLDRGVDSARHASRYMREVMRALAAYLSAFEAAHAAPANAVTKR